MTAGTDPRGLHPLDSGYVYAVRHGNRSKRVWFKTKGDALARAEWLRGQGFWAAVVRYTISDEEPL